MYDPARASGPYPDHLHLSSETTADGLTVRTPLAVDAQVFRDDTDIVVVNSTPRSFSDFHLWLNQRYARHVDRLDAGQTIRLSLWDFFDQWGGRFNAGGFFRSYEPTPVRLVEIQLDDAQPMVGLIAVQIPEPERVR